VSLQQIVHVGTAGLRTLDELAYRGTRACKLPLEVLSLALQIVCDPVGPTLSLAEGNLPAAQQSPVAEDRRKQGAGEGCSS